MKLVVDEIPKKSIECLFSYKDHPDMITRRRCSFDYGVCRLEQGESCKYLEERKRENEYDNEYVSGIRS